jgi:GT2 family glycosyltransferase
LLGGLGVSDGDEYDESHVQFFVPEVGVPVLEPCPPEVRVPLRAVMRQSFLAGNRAAPLVDGLLDVAGWTTYAKPLGQSGDWSAQIVVPVRGAHEAFRLCLQCLAATDLLKAHVSVPCAQDEAEGVLAIAEERRGGPGGSRRVTVDVTDAPQSFAANVNLAASRSRSEFLVLLNSDAFVGPDWLDALLAPFADPEIVAVGPMGTNVSGHQGVEPIALAGGVVPPFPTTPAEVAAFARRAAWMTPELSTAPYAARRLVGFCLAVRRSAFDRVGGMDERYAVGNFEDDDLCLRLSLVGKCVVVPDLLVLHAGQASFRELPDAENVYRRALFDNHRRYLAKWGWIAADVAAWFDERGLR